MKLTITITDQEIQRSVHRALTCPYARRLSVRDWVIRDLTERIPFVTGCRQSEYAKDQNFRPLVAEAIKGRLDPAAFDAGLSKKDKEAIANGKAILSSDGGKYHAVYR